MSKPGKRGTQQQVTDSDLAQENEKLTIELAQTKQLYERLLKESQEAETKAEEKRADLDRRATEAMERLAEEQQRLVKLGKEKVDLDGRLTEALEQLTKEKERLIEVEENNVNLDRRKSWSG